MLQSVVVLDDGDIVVLEYDGPVVIDIVGLGDLETRPDLGLLRSVHVSIDEIIEIIVVHVVELYDVVILAEVFVQVVGFPVVQVPVLLQVLVVVSLLTRV